MRILVIIAATLWLMVQLRSVLQPLAVGALVWLLLTATSDTALKLLPQRFRDARTTARVFSTFVTLLILVVVGVLIANDVATLGANLEIYEHNLDSWLNRVATLFDTEKDLSVVGLLERVDFRSIAIQFAGSTASYLATFFAVLLYLMFILLEAGAVEKKVAALARHDGQEQRLRGYLSTIKQAIDDFLSVQMLIGVVQAVPTFVLLKIIGVDGPVLWAVLIFLLSFIPTIGTLFGILIPSAMTLLQFSTLTPFLVVFGVLGTIQLASTNILMPQLMSRSLNLSPLIVMFAVFLGGTVWGIVGAIIAVPALTIMLIVCAGNPSWRSLAVILSADGQLPTIPGPPSHPDAEPKLKF